MIVNGNVYALLIGVGDYRTMGVANLPTYKTDLVLLGSALMAGLKVPKDNIWTLAGEDSNGYVSMTEFTKAIAIIQKKISEKDILIIYFSGHGAKKKILFSDGQISLQSIINYVEKLSAKCKWLIMDCCYSGGFETMKARQMYFEESISEFLGRGIAVMASCAADEISRLGQDGTHSMFTGALSTAIGLNKRVKKGKTSLNDIYNGMMDIVNVWNSNNPGKEQQPVFRSNIGGTIYFQIGEDISYKPKECSFETVRYEVTSVTPLSSLKHKRLCAFVLLKQEFSKKELADIAKEIGKRIRYEEIYSTKASENRFRGTAAKAVWCYFGKDYSDIVNHLHFAYTIWSPERAMRKFYYKENKNATICDDVYIFQNTSYSMLKKMQQPTMTREQFIAENRELLTEIVTLAGVFINDLQEVANQTVEMNDLQIKYREWTQKVTAKYLKLTDCDVAPDDLHDWSEEIMSLAGWILDLAVLMDNKGNQIGDRELWLIHNAVDKYYQSLERLSELERIIKWEDC